MTHPSLVSPAPPRVRANRWIGSAVPLLRDPVAFLERCRKRLGETFLIRFFGFEMLFVFSPEGVRNLWATPESELSKGFADYEMLRVKVPDELFQGRRTRPHDLFARDDVAEYLKNVEGAVNAELDAMGESGEIELFGLTRRVGHRVGLASWGGITGAATRYLDDIIDALNALDSADAFVRPVQTLAARMTGKRAARKALSDLESLYGRVLEIRATDPPETPDLFDRICANWSDVESPEREIGIARDAALVHMGSMSNLFAAQAWTVIHLLDRPELLEKVRNGDTKLLQSCAHESIRLHQRSIVLRRAVQETSIADEQTTYQISPGAFVVTMMPNTNTSAADGLESFTPENYAGARFVRTKDIGARELVSTFGHGAHACPAMRFSIEAIQALVIELLGRFELEALFSNPGPLRNQIGGIARADRPCRIRYSRRRR